MTILKKIGGAISSKTREIKKSMAEEFAYRKELKREERRASRKARLAQLDEIANQREAIRKEEMLKAYREKVKIKYSPRKYPSQSFSGLIQSEFQTNSPPQKTMSKSRRKTKKRRQSTLPPKTYSEFPNWRF